MDFDHRWKSLLKPGDATRYFEVHHDKPFEPEARGYSPVNAWWLAELSRLIYKEGKGEPEPSRGDLTREEVLHGVDMTETFRRSDEAQLAVIKPKKDESFRIVVFRGSHNLRDWLTNLQALPAPWEPRGRVHHGFQAALNTVWDALVAYLAKETSPLFFTGHSLGAALATLAAARYRQSSQLYTFGSPFVGDQDFLSGLENVACYQVINNLDLVTTVPPGEGFLLTGRVHYLTKEGKLLIEPTPDQIAADRRNRDRWELLRKYLRLRFTDAPKRWADHSPVNYVAHLERAI